MVPSPWQGLREFKGYCDKRIGIKCEVYFVECIQQQQQGVYFSDRDCKIELIQAKVH